MPLLLSVLLDQPLHALAERPGDRVADLGLARGQAEPVESVRLHARASSTARGVRRLRRTLAPQSIPFASRVRCLVRWALSA